MAAGVAFASFTQLTQTTLSAENVRLVPPSLWIYDTETGEEVQWTGVHGTHFQWYDVTPYFGSFLLWGLDSMESNRNVALADLRPYLRGQGWKPPLPGKVLSAEEVERIVGGRP